MVLKIHKCTNLQKNDIALKVAVLELTLLCVIQEAQLMLTTGSTRLAVSRGQQTWYHSTCNI